MPPTRSTGTVRAADNTAPTVISIERQDPTASLTNSDTPTWRVTFSEAVKNVDPTDFTIAGHDRRTDGHTHQRSYGRAMTSRPPAAT